VIYKYIRLCILFFIIIISSEISLAQKKEDDCAIYEKILFYFNKKAVESKIIYGGIIDPESRDLGTAIEDKETKQYNFYIVNNKLDFEYLIVRDWFSKLINDSTIIQDIYNTNKDTIINCIFDSSIKFKYSSYDNINLSKQDEINEKKIRKNIYYSSMRLNFSKILYTKDSRALVYAKIYIGKGNGRDILVNGFVFKNIDNSWILDRVESEIR
jgi:hypothetical protein